MTLSQRDVAPTQTIEQTILIRASSASIFAALTERNQIEGWWGAVSSEATENERLWPGVSDGDSRMFVQKSIPNELLVLRWDQPHPDDPSRVFAHEVQFSLEQQEAWVLVTIEHSGIPDETSWVGAFAQIRRGWPVHLHYFQAWVESGRRRHDLTDPAKFGQVTRTMNVGADQDWTWRALTEPALMGQWLDARVRCTADVGGEIDIVWPDGSHVGGESVFVDPPHQMIMHWWDAESLAKNDDPGLVTVMRWTLTPIGDAQTRLELVDTGYDLTRVDDQWMASINEGWDGMLGNLVALGSRAKERSS